MKLITRKDLGWPPSAAALWDKQKGTKIHYEGTRVPSVTHDKCAGRWTAIRDSHLANTQENYSDIAYSMGVCQHGYVYEGRGPGRKTGANGNRELNEGHYAVLVMIGSSGDTQPSKAAVAATREVIAYLREHGAGNEIKGHRDGFATSCPGEPLYALVKSGALEPGTAPTQPQEDDIPFPTDLAESVAGGPPLHPEEWGTVAVAADQVLVEGPCAYSLKALIRLEGTPGARVDARFFFRRPDGHKSDDLEEFAGVFDKFGKLSIGVSHDGVLAEGHQLKLELKSEAAAVVKHRVLRGLRFPK